MRFFVGTSECSYKEWKGSFYPEKLPQKEMLSYYAQRFSTVEINNTFYQMPKASVLESWADQVPDSFRLVLKAPRVITHDKRLKSVEQEMDYLLRTASVLKRQLGPLLFQLPPNFKKDLPRLEAFLGLIGKETLARFRVPARELVRRRSGRLPAHEFLCVCFGCHSAQAKEIKGGLRLDTRLDPPSGSSVGYALA